MVPTRVQMRVAFVVTEISTSLWKQATERQRVEPWACSRNKTMDALCVIASQRVGARAPPDGAGATLGAGTLIAFATAPGQVALDGEGAHSPFSAALSRHIGTPGLEVQQMLTRVRAKSSRRPRPSRCRGRTRRCSARSIWRRSEPDLSTSLRGAKRRSNPSFLYAERWIASLRSQ
jgi:hypothetical protein